MLARQLVDGYYAQTHAAYATLKNKEKIVNCVYDTFIFKSATKTLLILYFMIYTLYKQLVSK